MRHHFSFVWFLHILLVFRCAPKDVVFGRGLGRLGVENLFQNERTGITIISMPMERCLGHWWFNGVVECVALD